MFIYLFFFSIKLHGSIRKSVGENLFVKHRSEYANAKYYRLLALKHEMGSYVSCDKTCARVYVSKYSTTRPYTFNLTRIALGVRSPRCELVEYRSTVVRHTSAEPVHHKS